MDPELARQLDNICNIMHLQMETEIQNIRTNVASAFQDGFYKGQMHMIFIMENILKQQKIAVDKSVR